MSPESSVILGAGISGIGAAYRLGKDSLVFEARERYGGLCDNFTVDGFRFDYAVHLSFTDNPLVRQIFDSVPFFVHDPEAQNYCDGRWVRHPIQNNSYGFPIDERIRIIKSFLDRTNKRDVKTYRDWLRFHYGEYFSEAYPERYTRKYWCCEANELSANWIGNRMHSPTIDEVLYGAMTDDTPNAYYTREMRYPKKGGFRAFFEHIGDQLDIRLNHRLISIDPVKKHLYFENGKEFTYRRLISSLPLPEIIHLITNCPKEIVNAAKRLRFTSICLISVGFRERITFPSLWFYVYDESIPFARAYSPSMKSHDNAPEGKSSLQFEVYYTRERPLRVTENALVDKVLCSMTDMKIAQECDVEVIDIRHVDYANVVFYNGMEKDRKKVHDYLESSGILSIGRFGEWDYFWSDQSFLSGYNIAMT